MDDGDGVQMLFDFRTCAAQWLAHARGSAEPLIDALSKRPRIPERAQFANFCRHHDELNIGMLSEPPHSTGQEIALSGYGFRWLRLD
jgi:maltose alpha-D-glucosyltransferase / alpha-amylase